MTLAEPPVAQQNGPHSWGFEYPFTVLRVSRAALLTTGLAQAVPVTGDAAAMGRTRPRAWVWLQEEPDTVIRHGERAGGLVWWAGTPYGSDRIERPVVAVGSAVSTGQPVVRVDLGHGLVRDGGAIADELWVAIARRRYLAVPRDCGVDVLAISASGAVRTVHSADSVDISTFAPAVNRPPQAQIADHINEVRHRFDDLTTAVAREDGTTTSIRPELTELSASVEGEWPDACAVVIMRHQSRPGLVLRRTLPLFDEAGAPINHESAGWRLMEDLDTNYLAPAGEAVDGVLDT